MFIPVHTAILKKAFSIVEYQLLYLYDAFSLLLEEEWDLLQVKQVG